MKGGNTRDHTMVGPTLSVDPRGRGFSVRCRCRRVSESYPSPIVAEAAGEQHLQLENGGSHSRK